MGGTGYSTDGPVLVLGATGTVGSELVRQLAAGGAPVRAFVRDEARARDLFGQLTVELALGDLSEPETVKRAARGCAQLFLLTRDGPQQVEQETGAARAAADAGVAHIVSLSSSDSGRDAPFAGAKDHYAIEQHVESLGVDYSHLRPHYFMQNLLGALQVEAGSVVLRLPLGSGRISAIDVRDIAACAAAVLASTPLGRPAVLTGGESFTLDEAASVVAQHSGIPIRYDDEEPRAQSRMDAGARCGAEGGGIDLAGVRVGPGREARPRYRRSGNDHGPTSAPTQRVRCRGGGTGAAAPVPSRALTVQVRDPVAQWMGAAPGSVEPRVDQQVCEE